MAGMSKPWWTDSDYIIDNGIEYHVAYVKYAYARETASGWEYALTTWRYGSPTLNYVLRGGVCLRGSDLDAYMLDTSSPVAECLTECAARLDAALPTVIRNRRPTREEVHAASIGGVSLWLATVPWLAMPRTCWATTANPVTFLGVHDNRRSVSLDGSRAPGEVWRPIGPDGEPMTLKVEVPRG